MSLIAGFLQQCEKTPDKIAFCEENRVLTYAQFQQQAESLAIFLQQNRKTSQPIAILLERGIDAAIAIYAVLMSGTSYLPLDVKNPTSRLAVIIADAQPEMVIGKGEKPNWIDNSVGWLSFPRSGVGMQPWTLQRPVSPRWSTERCVPTPERGNDNSRNIAAILYTSGSTGTPKGVALSHSAMLNFANWAAQTFDINPQDKIASLAPFHFDLSVFDLFSSLNSGASVYFLPANLTLSPSRLTAWLHEKQITCWYTVPSLLSFLAFKGGLENTPLLALTRLLFAGEVFPSPHLIKLAQLLSHTALYNLYGPTETNVCCYWQVERGNLQAEQTIPIGIPACGATLEISENAELLVACENNFSGYWQQGKLIPRDRSKPYATGDKVSLNNDGEYCYHGRLDRMLKCSGYRVEPAEIETVLNHINGVQTCAVIGVQDASSGQRPAAVLVLENDDLLADIVKIARSLLPAYMMPCKFKTLAVLPTLSNGKTDYLALHSLFDSHD